MRFKYVLLPENMKKTIIQSNIICLNCEKLEIKKDLEEKDIFFYCNKRNHQLPYFAVIKFYCDDFKLVNRLSKKIFCVCGAINSISLEVLIQQILQIKCVECGNLIKITKSMRKLKVIKNLL